MIDDKTETETKHKRASELNYEKILGGQITRVMTFRDTEPTQYASSVETYLIFCPKTTRDLGRKYMNDHNIKRRTPKDHLNDGELLRYDDLLVYINELLEVKEGMIFRTSTYEVGKE